MSRAGWWGVVVACALWGGGLAPSVARADEADEEFESNWIGVRGGFWYQPAFDMEVVVSGEAFNALGLPGSSALGLAGTRLDIEDDLDVSSVPTSDYMFEGGILDAEVFLDLGLVTISAWGVAPFQYEGSTVRTVDVNFAGFTFTAGVPIESKFRQWLAATDVKLNLLNNSIVRLSPLFGLRILAIDWELSSPGLFVADTSDIDSPLRVGDDQLLPYPEIGLEVRVGLREWFEVDAKLSGMIVDYLGFEGASASAEAGLTVYPIPQGPLGIRLGLRALSVDFEASEEESDEDFFDIDMQFLGANLSLILRF